MDIRDWSSGVNVRPTSRGDVVLASGAMAGAVSAVDASTGALAGSVLSAGEPTAEGGARLLNLVCEATPGTATKRNAQDALSNIRLLPGESGPSTIDRLTHVFRAATVNADSPALSEEEYFWMAIGAEDLQALCDRAIFLCYQASNDISTFRSVLMQRTEQNNTTSQNYPVDVHALGSPAMVERGAAARRCFYGFTAILGQNSIYYWNTVGAIPKAAPLTGVSKPPMIGGVAGRRETAKMPPRVPNTGATTAALPGATDRHPRGRQSVPPPPSTATTDTVGGPRNDTIPVGTYPLSKEALEALQGRDENSVYEPTPVLSALNQAEWAAGDEATPGFPAPEEAATPEDARNRRLKPFNPRDADIVNSQVNMIREKQIVDYSDSQWCSRIVIQYKKDGKPRLTIGYRPLNAVMKENSGAIGTISTMHYRVRKIKWFTQVYHQIPIKASDRHKTAFRDARRRLYQFNRCSFGLTTIPAAFSALLGDTLRPAENSGCIVRCLDDVLIHTETLEEHFKVLEEVLDLLQKAGYSVHCRKSVFCMPEVAFLGVMTGNCRSHSTDTSERAAGAVLTQLVEHRDSAIGFGSHGWTLAESRRAPTDREGRAALVGLDHFRTYLLHRPFTLVTDCSAITWLFTGQHLSSMIQVRTTTLRWRKDTEHTVPDALSRLPQKWPARQPIDTFFPDDTSSPSDRIQEPLGAVLDGVPLQDLALAKDAEEPEPTPDNATVSDNKPPGGTPTLDGIQLAALGATEIAAGPELPSPVIWALQHTFEMPDPTDHRRLAVYEEVREALTPRRPRAGVLGCGAGGALPALGDTLRVDTAIEPDWTTLECARANAWSHSVTLVRTPLASPSCRGVIAEAKPEVIIGNACRRYDPDHIGNTAARQATDVIDAFLSSRATLLVLECPVCFTGTMEWKETLTLHLKRG
eukprot:g14879.t1